jgi:hypothetical protein
LCSKDKKDLTLSETGGIGRAGIAWYWHARMDGIDIQPPVSGNAGRGKACKPEKIQYPAQEGTDS